MAARANGIIELTVAEIVALWEKFHGPWNDVLDPEECMKALILDLGAEQIERELKCEGFEVSHVIDEKEDQS